MTCIARFSELQGLQLIGIVSVKLRDDV